MKISAKARYGLAVTVSMSKGYASKEYVTVLSLSEKLNISKIYLEQVFALLKRGGIVVSTKGAQGGYRLSRTPESITAFDVLATIETSLFEKAERTTSGDGENIDRAIGETVFDKLDAAVKGVLTAVTLDDIARHAEGCGGYMYYL